MTLGDFIQAQRWGKPVALVGTNDGGFLVPDNYIQWFREAQARVDRFHQRLNKARSRSQRKRLRQAYENERRHRLGRR